jgi:tRNA nucleotidyltransferase (CCA-adding enzyme)
VGAAWRTKGSYNPSGGFTLLTTIPDIHADVLTRLNSNVPRSRLVLPDPVDTNRSVQTPESVSSWTCFSPKL